MAKLTPHQLKALDYTRHISLTANAGSGKTFILSKRYVEIAVRENISLNNIVAITFTDKAAGELNKKIAAEIEDRIITENDPDKIKILNRVRRQLVSANISTIHSFCVNILREFSPEAGLDARFIPVDQKIADEMIDLSIEESLNSLIRDVDNSDKIKYLIRFFGSKKLLTNQLRSLLRSRRNIEKLVKELYTREALQIAAHFNKRFRDDVAEIFREEIEQIIPVIKNLNHTVLTESEENKYALEISSLITRIENTKDVIELFDLLNRLREEVLVKKGTLRKQGYLKKDAAESLLPDIDLIEKFFEKIKVISIPSDYEKAEVELAHFGKILTTIFEFVHTRYAAKKKQKGYLDFEDILLFTQDLIGKAEVREYLNQRFSYIMIDEYQDTNEVQYNIFMPILDYLRTGNLFIVGDEKQSIYMFRDAELEVFNRTKNEIVSEVDSSALLELPHSFRLAPQIAVFTNKLFQNLFQNPDLKFNEVAHSELICVKDETEKGGIELLLSDSSNEDELESDFVAKRISKFIDQKSDAGLGFGDIAVLCRKRSAFAELERSFLKYNIPFAIVGGKGFYQRQIIHDIHNYLSFLLDYKNDTALVGLLRSPFFTFSDIEIFNISLMAGKSFYDKLVKYSSENNELVGVIAIFKKHISLASKTDITSILRTILIDTGYLAVIASRTNSKQELANIEKLVGIAGSFSSQSFRTLYDFVNHLAEAIDSLDDEAQAAVETEENAVKILTLHQAKGLEYKAVFLYRCNDYTKEDQVKSKSISIDKNMGVLTKVPIDKNYFEEYVAPPIVGLFNYVMHRKQASEIKRLLYVGITRAANYLFISAALKDDRLHNDSFLKFIVEGLGIDLSQESFELCEPLKFMKLSGNGFAANENKLKISIPIVRSIEDDVIIKEKFVESPTVEKIHVEPIKDLPKREIVSATKIAVFLQCPVKYQLIYELGYSRVFQMIKKQRSNYEFKYKEDEETKYFADVKGRVIHSILENIKDAEDIQARVKILLNEELDLNNIDADDYEDLEKNINSDLYDFYNSDIYDVLTSFGSAENELEIYTEENDYYLYGIIDKIVIEDNRAIIIDYKTDTVKPEQIDDKAEGYLPQLKFYSYIVSKLYKQIEEFELWLVFIRSPETKFSVTLTKNEIHEFGNSVEEIVNKMRRYDFQPEYNHCRKCHFFLDNKHCIKGYS